MFRSLCDLCVPGNHGAIIDDGNDSLSPVGGEDPESQGFRMLAPQTAPRINRHSPPPPLSLRALGINCLKTLESESFDNVIASVIGAQMLVLWGETDIPDYWAWAYLEFVFLSFFALDIFLRVALKGRVIFRKPELKWWAFSDCGVVLVGILDFFVMVSSDDVNGWLVRIMRLSRLTRAIRLFRMFKVLRGFIQALKAMLGTFVLVFSVLIVLMVMIAIVLTHLLGHAEALPSKLPAGATIGPGATDQSIEELVAVIHPEFKTVVMSLFTLFRLMITDKWNSVASPLVILNPWWRIAFMVYIVFGSWTMISVLTAVACDQMIAATSSRKDDKAKEHDKNRREFINFLRDSFLEADTDENGLLDKQEFSDMMKQDFVHVRMAQLGIIMSQDELFKCWDMLDIHAEGELTIDEFVTGLAYLQEGLSTKHIVSVDYTLKRVAVRVQAKMDVLRDTIDVIKLKSEDVLENMRTQEEWLAEQQRRLWLWQHWASKNDSKVPPPGEEPRWTPWRASQILLVKTQTTLNDPLNDPLSEEKNRLDKTQTTPGSSLSTKGSFRKARADSGQMGATLSKSGSMRTGKIEKAGTANGGSESTSSQ